MKLLDKVYFTLSNKRRLGYVLKVNNMTVWVKVMFGASNAVAVKRHIIKNNVKYYGV